MISPSKETNLESIGTETYESFGFLTEEELDIALLPLMQEAPEQFAD